MQVQADQNVVPGRRRLTGRILAVAAAAGLATGLLEALWLSLNQLFRARVIFTSDYILWMTPLLYALIFVLVALGVTAVGAALYPKVKESHAVFVFVALGVLCLFIPITQIARWAALVVAIGVGTQAARIANGRPGAFRTVSLRGLGVLGTVALLTYFGGRLSSRSEPPGDLVRDDLPNIVVIVWDTVRSESLSLYGYSEPTTPGLEQLAAESVVFEHAVSPSPWTLPAHASMFTGRWPAELSTTWLDALDDEYPTLAEVLSSRGYATGGFIANHDYTSYDSGLTRGFHAYGDYRVTFRQFVLSSWLTQTESVADLLLSDSWADAWSAIRQLNFWVGVKRANHRKHADEVNAELLSWLDRTDDRPFFAFLNYFDAHGGYWSPPGTVARFTAEDRGMRGYDAAISYLDGEVTALIDTLRARGVLDNTLIVVTSDHGELFGEKGLRGHAHNVYYPTVHVPLLIRGPGGVPAGLRVEAEVSTRDLSATLLDLIGVQDETGIGGSSLSRFWATPPAGSGEFLLTQVEQGRNNPPREPISRGPLAAVLSDSLQFILNGDGVEELYNYRSDPRAEVDLSGDPAHQAAAERLRRALSNFPQRRP